MVQQLRDYGNSVLAYQEYYQQIKNLEDRLKKIQQHDDLKLQELLEHFSEQSRKGYLDYSPEITFKSFRAIIQIKNNECVDIDIIEMTEDEEKKEYTKPTFRKVEKKDVPEEVVKDLERKRKEKIRN